MPAGRTPRGRKRSRRARGTPRPRSSRVEHARLSHPSGRLLDLLLDPPVGGHKAFLERDLGLPAEDFPQLVVVGVASADPLRTVDVLEPEILLAGNLDHELG